MYWVWGMTKEPPGRKPRVYEEKEAWGRKLEPGGKRPGSSEKNGVTEGLELRKYGQEEAVR